MNTSRSDARTVVVGAAQLGPVQRHDSRSSSVRASRHDPPPGIGDTSARASMRARSRAGSIRTSWGMVLTCDDTREVYKMSKTFGPPWAGLVSADMERP